MSTPLTTYGYGRGSYGSGNYGSDYAIDDDGDTSDGTAILLIRGTASVAPQLRITGPCKSPQVTFNTIGTTIYLKGLELTEDEYLIIDVASRQVLLNGEFTQSRYNYLSLSSADGWNGWAYLVEGLNSVVFLTESQGAGCKLEITWRDEWI